MNNTFSLEIAQNLYSSVDNFPVDFEYAWQWLNFSRKDVAKKSFLNCGFSESLDYTSFRQKVEREIGATTKEVIKLSVDCFKTWAMMANTSQGKLVRKYFLECEKIAKEKQLIKPKTALELAREQVKLLEQIEFLEQEKQLLEQENHQLAEAVDELFDYSSIIRVAKFNKCDETNFSWRKLKAASFQLGLEVKQVPCPRYQIKNLYPHQAWRLVYPGYSLPETLTLVIK